MAETKEAEQPDHPWSVRIQIASQPCSSEQK